ncbi:MAG: RNA methyltransferase [Deltaproteobacteria bacterium]|nr:RNA methyltransferase [Deltaproteobacteria bacterium]
MDNISILLLEPRGPRNIGSVARAMKNTGFSQLVLINPVPYKNNEAYEMACKADDLLQEAELFQTLDEALHPFPLVVGTTRRGGKERFPLLTLNEAIPKIAGAAVENRVALLFGREDKGLTTNELARCNILVEIPTHPSLPSLNLSHAVFILCHRLFTAFEPEEPSFVRAPRGEVEGLYNHIEVMLKGLGYGDKGGEYLLRTIMRNLKRLLGRTGLMHKEVNMLRGICAQIEKRTNGDDNEGS